MVYCPALKRPVPTGISMPKATFDAMTDEQLSQNSFGCQCGDMHTWDRENALMGSD
jgi:hypothetical protein